MKRLILPVVILATLVSTACAESVERPSATVLDESPVIEPPDGFVRGPVDLHKMTAIVRVSVPDRLKTLFTNAAARTSDPDLATFLRAQAMGGFGSGFVVVRRKAGRRHAFVVTNRHVVNDAEDAEVRFPNAATYAH